jgi:hypothetical protein
MKGTTGKDEKRSLGVPPKISNLGQDGQATVGKTEKRILGVPPKIRCPSYILSRRFHIELRHAGWHTGFYE